MLTNPLLFDVLVTS